MPTNRTREKRTRAGANDIQSWLRWHTTILLFVSPTGRMKSPWTGESSLAFWRKHRKIIMAAYLEQNREKNRPFQRPDIFFGELEEKHPRRKTGTHKWIGPVRSDGGDRTRIDDVFETDYQYLKRLGLLEPWKRMSIMPTNRNRRTRNRKDDKTKEIPDDLLFHLRYGYDYKNPLTPPLSKQPPSHLYGEVVFFMFHEEKLQWLLDAWAKHEKLIREGVDGEPYILELIERERDRRS